jgi:hypothetical protein
MTTRSEERKKRESTSVGQSTTPASKSAAPTNSTALSDSLQSIIRECRVGGNYKLVRQWFLENNVRENYATEKKMMVQRLIADIFTSIHRIIDPDPQKPKIVILYEERFVKDYSMLHDILPYVKILDLEEDDIKRLMKLVRMTQQFHVLPECQFVSIIMAQTASEDAFVL